VIVTPPNPASRPENVTFRLSPTAAYFGSQPEETEQRVVGGAGGGVVPLEERSLLRAVPEARHRERVEEVPAHALDEDEDDALRDATVSSVSVIRERTRFIRSGVWSGSTCPAAKTACPPRNARVAT
jgi:hypothetical protein